jgi:hypothetical protein
MARAGSVEVRGMRKYREEEEHAAASADSVQLRAMSLVS